MHSRPLGPISQNFRQLVFGIQHRASGEAASDASATVQEYPLLSGHTANQKSEIGNQKLNHLTDCRLPIADCWLTLPPAFQASLAGTRSHRVSTVILSGS